MKQLQLLILALLITSAPAIAQIHDYAFNGNFNSGNAAAPALVENLSCGASNGTFVTEQVTTVAGDCSLGSKTFAFNGGDGLQYNNAGFISNTYTINMFFKFSSFGGSYARVVDFLNSSSDAGVYIISNCLNFYPNGNVGTCPNFVDGNYYLITLARDGATNQIKIYVNGALFNTYNDVSNTYSSAGGTTPILFFRDDNAVQCEVRAGNVRYISLSPQLSTDAEVLAVWNNLCTVILPIKLSYFNASKTATSNVELSWQSSNEQNSSHFILERSTDGLNFLPLTKIIAKNRPGTHNYSYTDKAASAGNNFYRLKQVDINGSFEYSDLRKVVMENAGEKAEVIYKNGPWLTVSDGWLNAKATMLNVNAQVLSKFVVSNNLQQIDLGKYAAGIYFVRLKKNDKITTLKIIKQ